jgi:hypothetical protein
LLPSQTFIFPLDQVVRNDRKPSAVLDKVSNHHGQSVFKLDLLELGEAQSGERLRLTADEPVDWLGEDAIVRVVALFI